MFPTNILLCAGFLTAYLSIYVSAIMSVSMWYIHFEMSVFNKKKKKGLYRTEQQHSKNMIQFLEIAKFLNPK